MTEPALVLDDVWVRDGAGGVLVRGISASIAPGAALVVIGETGSGKSLLAQAVLGLLPPGLVAGGHIRLAGVAPVPLNRPDALQALWARQLAFLPQEPGAALDPTMRVGRQLEGARRAPTAPPVAAALAAVDLAPGTARAYPFALSGGMAQRALVATAMLGSAPVVVADEPTKGLDAERVGQVRRLLHTLLAHGRALVVITHDLALARGLGGSVLVMKDGAAVECGPAARVLSQPTHGYTRDWLAADPAGWPPRPRGGSGGTAVLHADGLGFAWPGGRPLFRDIEIVLRPGQVLAFTGPSGCGKTTLGNILLGLRPPTAGRVGWGGTDPYRDRAGARLQRRRYQKLHQDPATAFLPQRTLRRHFADLAEVVPGLDVGAALPRLLDRLRLRAGLLDRRAGEISGGEAQRLALARLLLLDPAVIVADEPTSRLDPIVQRETLFLLRELADDGLAVVLVSHDRAVVRALADGEVRLG